MTGTFSFSFFSPLLGRCTGGSFPFAGSRAPCGNGVVDPGETCDDGGPITGICCQLGCTASA